MENKDEKEVEIAEEDVFFDCNGVKFVSFGDPYVEHLFAAQGFSWWSEDDSYYSLWYEENLNGSGIG